MLNNETLLLCRNYLGLSQKQFALKIGVSQALISNIEKNSKPLGVDVIQNLVNDFSEEFFNSRLTNPDLKVHYRASATIAKKLTDLFEARIQIISNVISQLLEYVEIPKNKVPVLDLEDHEWDPEHLANYVRGVFNLGSKPIDDIVNLLEKQGVIIYFYDYDFISAQNKNFDGVSFYISGVPVIMINEKIQNARKVFTIAHELGHLIMHNGKNYIGKERDIEKEANVFASEFVAPRMFLRGEFINLTMEKLFLLKSYWKLSAAALLYKAKDMTLSIHQYRRWWTKMAPYKKVEPNDIELESPKLLKKMIEVSKNDYGFDSILSDFGLSKSVYENVFSTIIEKDSRSKLKILF